MSAILFLFLWFRATFPRYRYDQIMRLGWKVFIPICLVWLVVVGVWMMSPLEHLEMRRLAMGSMKEIFNSLLLRELLKGMSVTGQYLFARKITVQYPEEKTPQSFRFRGLHALRRYPERRGALHRLQAVRGGLSRRWRSPSRPSSVTTGRAARRATTSI